MPDRKPTQQLRNMAQDLAYRAMESADPQRMRELSRQALKIDPRCVDARVMLAQLEPDTEKSIAKLRECVEIATEELGGAPFFEANRGYFWGMLETRPYMRARSSLAMLLLETGDSTQAIRELAGLLELCPDDNLGLREPLLGQYLATGRLDAARELLKRYGEDHSALFAWGVVVERLLSADEAGAQAALPQAFAVNPHVADYLAGRRKLPRQMPAWHGLGDDSEAQLCMGILGHALLPHPQALDWLYLQAEALRAPQVGRNEPCPCGSGLKYKKCCLNKGPVITAPAAGQASSTASEQFLREMKQAMGDREFANEQELQEFMNAFQQEYNMRGQEDLAGLSPLQLKALLYKPFASPELLEFPAVLASEPQLNVVRLFMQLAEALGETGVKATAKGNLPRALVLKLAQSVMGAEGFAKATRHFKIRGEEDYWDLFITRHLARHAGLLRLYRGRWQLSAKCSKLLAGEGSRAIYPVLLHSYVTKFDWSSQDAYPRMDLIQQAFAFTLYLLHRFGNEWRVESFYADAFLAAFPSILNEIPDDAFFTPERSFRNAFTIRSLVRFAEFMGLLELDLSGGLAGVSKELEMTVRKSALLDDAVLFKIQPCA